MQKNNDNILHLLANPSYHKKKENNILDSIDDQLLLLIQRRFPHIRINKEDYIKNIEKIETLFYETYALTIINEVIKNTIDLIVNEQVLL
tara:strand:+ start:1422 stop:1691 length:270 start_codon:yes stop_codon:yes gene_type:complete